LVEAIIAVSVSCGHTLDVFFASMEAYRNPMQMVFCEVFIASREFLIPNLTTCGWIPTTFSCVNDLISKILIIGVTTRQDDRRSVRCDTPHETTVEPYIMQFLAIAKELPGRNTRNLSHKSAIEELLGIAHIVTGL